MFRFDLNLIFCEKISGLYYHQTVTQSTPTKQEIATRSLGNRTTSPTIAGSRRAAASAAVAPAQRRDFGFCSWNETRTGSRPPRPKRTSTPEGEEDRSSLHHAGDNTPPRSSRSSCTGDEIHRRQPPAPHRTTLSIPQQDQKHPCYGEDGCKGQKLPWPATTSATRADPGDRKLTESTDPEADDARSFTARPHTASPERGRSSSHLIPRRRRHPQPSRDAGEPYPTIYRLRAQIEGPSTLPPPHRRPERDGTGDLAVSGARALGSSPFASLAHCSRERGRV